MKADCKKHPCPDCRACQWCSDDRCRLCLKPGADCREKLSIAEQIARYEELNRETSAANHGPFGSGGGRHRS